MLQALPLPKAYQAGQFTQLLAVVDRACDQDLPRVLDLQASLAFSPGSDLRAPRLDEVTVHSGLEPETSVPLAVVVGPCQTAAVYRDGVFLGLADATHPRFLASLVTCRFPVPLSPEYRIGTTAPALHLVHRT